ncbi:MAG: Carboxyl-terminal protease [Bacillales bacterium]|jgi:carboxyl-terminal processing protease|nr:Carboxyl-terminal protease [Bacillales bacterium]
MENFEEKNINEKNDSTILNESESIKSTNTIDSEMINTSEQETLLEQVSHSESVNEVADVLKSDESVEKVANIPAESTINSINDESSVETVVDSAENSIDESSEVSDHKNIVNSYQTPPKGFIKKKTVFIFAVLILFINALIGYKMLLHFGSKDVAEPTIHPEKDIEKIADMYTYIMNNYVEDVDTEKLVNGAIKGMVDSLGDKFSEYMSVDDAKQLNEMIAGSFEGIGAEISSHDGKIIIVTPIKGSPAEKSGLKRDDEIVSVDGQSLAGKSSTDAVKLIRGKKGTTVVLEILSPGENKPRKVSIVRGTIPIHSVKSHMEKDNIGYIEISSFSGNTADEFKEHLEDLEKQGMKGLILDLRGNPGGLMDVSHKVADYFVPAGKIIMLEEKKGEDKLPFLASKNDGKKVTVPVVVMIDGGSASASEIVAAALKESANATIVGSKSYGKGTIQRPADMPDGSNLKLTIGKWLTPNGNWIHEKGITPDIESKMSDYADFLYVSSEITYKSGDVSVEVENIKKILNSLGFNPGPLDGNFNSTTVDAVKAFQKGNNLPQTGVMTGETTIKLMEKLRDQMISSGDQQIIEALNVFKK